MGLFTGAVSGNINGAIPRNPSIIEMLGAHDRWNLNYPLFNWSPYDQFCLRKAYESVLVLGELGAAKSTASGALLLNKYLEIDAGGLYNCVKPGDADLLRSYAKMAGREDSLIVVSPGSKWRCNLMRYALKKPGISGSRVEALVSLLMTIVESTERADKGKTQNGDSFWVRTLRQQLRNGIEVCVAARNDITMRLLDEVISSAPRSHAEVQSADWQKRSTCYRIIEEAEAKSDSRSDREQNDYELAARYFLSDLPGMPDETRGSIYATYRSMADVLLRGHMADLFDSDTTFVPEVSHEGAIICLDLPTKVYGQAGINVQAAFTYLWQLAAEQRDVKANPRPQFWYLDEAQELIGNYTSDFLATARSARVASVLITQNLPNLFAAMGGEVGRHRVDAILGNTGTKIFHSNGDVVTNKMASETINDAVQTRVNYHGTHDGNTRGSGGGSENVGRKVLASEFTSLKKGGEPNGFVSEAIVYQTGASFQANGNEPWLRAAFKQIIPGVTVKPGKRY